MPKLNGVQIADRLRSRLEELRSGKEVAARDLKALLTEEQIAAMDTRYLLDCCGCDVTTIQILYSTRSFFSINYMY
jgi:hypothetical protein